eukprot:UN10887
MELNHLRIQQDKDIESIQKRHNELLNRIEKDHNDKIHQLKSAHRKLNDQLQNRISRLEKKNIELNTALQKTLNGGYDNEKTLFNNNRDNAILNRNRNEFSRIISPLVNGNLENGSTNDHQGSNGKTMHRNKTIGPT